MPRLKLRLAYQGTRYTGWQVNRKAESPPARPTSIQGCLEAAFTAVLSGRDLAEPVRVHGAGRTDAGVHALDQCAHADVPEDAVGINWQMALNYHLPRAIAVTAVEVARPDFHARYDATGKTYAYSLWLSRRYVLPQRRRFVWAVDNLDQEAMEAAAAHLVGEQDFAAFQNAGAEVGSTVRRLDACRCACVETPGCELERVWRFTGSGFLKQMVRNMMGCLVAVGRGKLAPADVQGILASRDRTAAPATAPAPGLTLERVFYDEA